MGGGWMNKNIGIKGFVLNHLIYMPRPVRIAALMAVDGAAILLSMWIAYALRLGEPWPPHLHESFAVLFLAPAITVPLLWFMGLYDSLLRYATSRVLYTLVRGVLLGLLLMVTVWTLLQGGPVPRTVWMIYGLVAVAFTGGIRMLLRDYLHQLLQTAGGRQPVIIYGAGAAGVQLATALRYNPELYPIAFVDDNPEICGSQIQGLKVHPPRELERLIHLHEVRRVLLAMPSVSHRRRSEIIERLSPLSVHVMALPGLFELNSGLRHIDELREVDVEDILGRDTVPPDPRLLGTCILGRVVMVTGAGGSIGSELCRQIIALGPARLILFERSEFALYTIERELEALKRRLNNRTDIVPMLGSVEHQRRMAEVMRTFGVQTVYHAAAYKHVPIVEQNPVEGVQNNVFGTLHAARAAVDAGVETFVLISTDKAVRPTNVMGASKRFAELILQGLALEQDKTRFCIVRFGNVLTSSGSVVPLFREQIRQGGPVTVTHPEVTRYFMTIPEAAQLVIQAGAMGRGGDIFLLDMGAPVRILDLARRLIYLAGQTPRDADHPHGTIDIVFSGLRPGEKLHEELLIGDANQPTEHPMIMRAVERQPAWSAVERYLARLIRASRDFDCQEVRAVLLESVEGYQPEGDIQDWIWLNSEPEQRNRSVMLPGPVEGAGNVVPLVSVDPRR